MGIVQGARDCGNDRYDEGSGHSCRIALRHLMGQVGFADEPLPKTTCRWRCRRGGPSGPPGGVGEDAEPDRPHPCPRTRATAESGTRRRSHRSAAAWAHVSRCHRRSSPLLCARGRTSPAWKITVPEPPASRRSTSAASPNVIKNGPRHSRMWNRPLMHCSSSWFER